MKKLFFVLLFPVSFFAQEKLTLDNILTISDKNSFLKEVIENGYSEGNSTKDKIYYGKGFKKENKYSDCSRKVKCLEFIKPHN